MPGTDTQAAPFATGSAAAYRDTAAPYRDRGTPPDKSKPASTAIWPTVAPGFDILAFATIATLVLAIVQAALAAVPTMAGWTNSNHGHIFSVVSNIVIGLTELIGLSFLRKAGGSLAGVASAAGSLITMSVLFDINPAPGYKIVSVIASVISTVLVIVYLIQLGRSEGMPVLVRRGGWFLGIFVPSALLLLAAAIMALNSVDPATIAVLGLLGLLGLIGCYVWQIVLFFGAARLLRQRR